MEAELGALAASGATTLVGLMVSDSWAQVSKRLGRFLGRGAEDEERSAELELRRSREELVAAAEDGDALAAADVEAGWRVRLRRVLQADPEAADELRRLLEELSPPPRDASAGAVHNTISGGVRYGTVVQGRDFTGLTFGGGTPPPRPDRESGEI